MLFIDGHLSRMDGVILVLCFIAFMLYVIKSSNSPIEIQLDAEGDIDTDNDGNQLSYNLCIYNSMVQIRRIPHAL